MGKYKNSRACQWGKISILLPFGQNTKMSVEGNRMILSIHSPKHPNIRIQNSPPTPLKKKNQFISILFNDTSEHTLHISLLYLGRSLLAYKVTITTKPYSQILGLAMNPQQTNQSWPHSHQAIKFLLFPDLGLVENKIYNNKYRHILK